MPLWSEILIGVFALLGGASALFVLYAFSQWMRAGGQ